MSTCESFKRSVISNSAWLIWKLSIARHRFNQPSLRLCHLVGLRRLGNWSLRLRLKMRLRLKRHLQLKLAKGVR